jgi:hypothetical protein
MGWLRSLPTFIRDDGYILVHAGIAGPASSRAECTREELTELRTMHGEPWFHFRHGPEIVIFGHWAHHGRSGPAPRQPEHPVRLHDSLGLFADYRVRYLSQA